MGPLKWEAEGVGDTIIGSMEAPEQESQSVECIILC